MLMLGNAGFPLPMSFPASFISQQQECHNVISLWCYFKCLQTKQTKKNNSATYQIPPWYYRCSLKEKSVKDIRKQVINARLGSTKKLQFTGYWLQFIKCTVIPIQVVYSFYSYPCLFAILQFTELLKRIIKLIKIQK